MDKNTLTLRWCAMHPHVDACGILTFTSGCKAPTELVEKLTTEEDAFAVFVGELSSLIAADEEFSISDDFNDQELLRTTTMVSGNEALWQRYFGVSDTFSNAVTCTFDGKDVTVCVPKSKLPHVFMDVYAESTQIGEI